MSKNYGRNQVAGKILSLETMGRDFVKSASVLLEKNNEQGGSGTHFITINLLASQALELLPKSLIATSICLNKNNNSLEEILRAINKKLACLGHELDDIFEEVPELKIALDVIKAERINSKTNENAIIDEFRFTIKNDSEGEKVIRIKNLEAARYGLFAKNQDIGGNSTNDIKNIVDFLKLLSEKTNELRVVMINDFDTKNKKSKK